MKILIKIIKTIFFIIVLKQYQVFAQTVTSDYSALLENDVLTIENSKVSRSYKWNKGNIISLSISDKESGKTWMMNTKRPDLSFPGQTDIAENAVFSSKIIAETAIAPEHLEAEIIYSLDKLKVKRIFRLYRDCPVIGCDIYLRGEPNTIWLQADNSSTYIANRKKLISDNIVIPAPVIEKIELTGKHWKLDIVEFSDITDRYNNLVFNINVLSYRINYYRGNILLAHDNLSDNGIFILKEAPTSNVQLAYPGSDFITEYGTFKVVGIGLNPSDLDRNEWKRCYGFATGVYSGSEINRLLALRGYQKKIRIHKPDRDEMVMMNTWGDRGEDKHICEKFAFAELEAGAKLGITHFQLDCGWQKGHQSLSYIQSGYLENIWSKNDYWEPHQERFPNGFDPIINKAKELGIEVCLWFNPSPENSNENWEKDANVLIEMYKNYGIRTFKIDGVSLPDKLAEINFRKFLEKVLQETDYNAIFNLDITSGRRGGYHYFNEYGNFWLENRYTDWQNYFPYSTLRNLWMLSKYLPPQNLLIEFLNKWRNTDKYEGDSFGPANYSFEYLIAITMAGQPLAYFEGSGLPEEAFSVAPVIKKYREIQFDFHNGDIFPIGDEPSGKSWTGFQSIQDGKGYFLIFREDNSYSKAEINTWLSEGMHIKCTPIIGKGQSFGSTVGKDGIVTFKLLEKNSYTLYKYSIK